LDVKKYLNLRVRKKRKRRSVLESKRVAGVS